VNKVCKCCPFLHTKNIINFFIFTTYNKNMYDSYLVLSYVFLKQVIIYHHARAGPVCPLPAPRAFKLCFF
jgi:hypothetical protein